MWRPTTLKHTNSFSPNGQRLCSFSSFGLGKPRLRNPENGKPVPMTGDLRISRKKGSNDPFQFKLFFKGEWYVVPTEQQFKEWTFDSVCESPDGRIVEPDAPDSWLSLMALV